MLLIDYMYIEYQCIVYKIKFQRRCRAEANERTICHFVYCSAYKPLIMRHLRCMGGDINPITKRAKGNFIRIYTILFKRSLFAISSPIYVYCFKPNAMTVINKKEIIKNGFSKIF